MNYLCEEENQNSGISNQDEYPIILYGPNSNVIFQENKIMYFFSESAEVVKFAESLGSSFLLIMSKDSDGESLLEELKKNACGRRLFAFEEGSILKELLKEDIKNYRVYVFATREEIENEVLTNEEIEEEMVGNDINL